MVGENEQMKRILICVLAAILMFSCLTACDLIKKDKGVTCEEYENCAVFTFCDFTVGETLGVVISGETESQTGLDAFENEISRALLEALLGKVEFVERAGKVEKIVFES